jgi:hypothetical protein
MKINQLRTLIKEIISQTMHRLDEVERGEWWIYPGGNAEFADKDIGDSSHEGLVISHLSHEIYEHFSGGGVPDEMGFLSDYEEDLKNNLVEEGRMSEEDLKEWDTRSPSEVIWKKCLEDNLFKDREQAKMALDVCWSGSSRDGRDYAMKYLGWKRMETSSYGTSVQTWLLRPEDLETLRRGVFDAWNDMGDEEETPDHSVNIEVLGPGRYFSDIPLKIFEKATVRNLIPYLKRSFQMKERKK